MENLSQIPERILKQAETQQASAIQPGSNDTKITPYEDLTKVLDEIWSQQKYDLNNGYKSGKSYFGIDSDSQYYDLIEALLNVIFTGIKDQVTKTYVNLEEQQKHKTIINSIQNALSSDIKILKAFNYKIDSAVLTATLNGYINKISGNILK